MKLKLVKNAEILKDYLVDSGFGHFIPMYATMQEFQRIYIITKNDQSIGFVELHHLKGRPDLFIARDVFESVFNTEENQDELAVEIIKKAKELDANTITVNVPEEYINTLQKHGFEPVQKIVTLRKEIKEE